MHEEAERHAKKPEQASESKRTAAPDTKPEGRIKEQPITYTNDRMIKGTNTETDHTYIFIDECGDLSKTAKKVKGKWDHSKIFALCASIVSKEYMEEFGTVTAEYKAKKKISGEFKTKRVGFMTKIIMGYKVRKIRAEIRGIYVDKTKDTPEGWMDKTTKGSDMMTGMFRQFLEDIICDISSDAITIVVDYHTAYGKKGGGNAVTEISEEFSENYNKTIIGLIGRKDYRSQMETEDLVCHAIFDRKQEFNPWASLIMRQKLKRLGKNDSIIRER